MVKSLRWFLLSLLATLGLMALCGCNNDDPENKAPENKAPEPLFNVTEIQRAFQSGIVCEMIRYPDGNLGNSPCQDTGKCSDPMYAICCSDACQFQTAEACQDYSPSCMARQTACEMAKFLADDSNLLAQPAAYVSPSRYPINNLVPGTQGMGNYNEIVWQVLQNLTAICYGNEDLMKKSDFLDAHKSGSIPNIFNSPGSTCTDPSVPWQCQNPVTVDPQSQNQLASAWEKVAVGGLSSVVSKIVALAGPGSLFVSAFAGPVVSAILGGTSGLPTNPCTYATNADWGNCVWGQVEKYVKSYVQTSEQEALIQFQEKNLQTELKTIHDRLASVNLTIHQGELNGETSSEEWWQGNVVNQIVSLANDLDGKWWQYSQSPLFPVFASLYLQVQFLAASLSSDSTRMASLFMNSLCLSKVTLKKAAALLQGRIAALNGTLVVDDAQLQGSQSDDSGGRWPGQIDSTCPPPDSDLKNGAWYTCKPNGAWYCWEREYYVTQTYCTIDTDKMDSCVVGGPANDYFLNWYCERSAIIAQQMNIWQTWVLPVYHAMNLVYKAGRAEVLRNMVFDSESWDCSELFGTDAQLFGASQDRNHPQLLADCPFEIKTTYQYTKGYVDKGTGARFELGLWHPAGSASLHWLGDACVQTENTQLEWMNSIMIKTISGKEDNLAKPTGMGFNWDDRGTHGDTDGGFFTPNCPSGYQPVGGVSVQKAHLDDSISPDNPPSFDSEPEWSNLRCVKEEFTEQVTLDVSRFLWKDDGSDGDYDGRVFSGKIYMAASGVMVYGPCHTARGHEDTLQVYQLKDWVVKWCTGKPLST